MGKFFLWLIVFFLWNFRPRLVRALLVTYIPKPGYVSWSCQPFGSETREKTPVHLTIHCPSATLSAMTRHAGQLNVSCHCDPLFLHRFDFCRNFWANILTCQGKKPPFSAKCTIPPDHPYLLRPFRGVLFHSTHTLRGPSSTKGST